MPKPGSDIACAKSYTVAKITSRVVDPARVRKEPGRSHCLTRHAVPIEPGLRSRSPKNGNISTIRRRLSAILLPQRPI
jgi:hypothetical protein